MMHIYSTITFNNIHVFAKSTPIIMRVHVILIDLLENRFERALEERLTAIENLQIQSVLKKDEFGW